jgi:hypothetical protein
MKPVEALRRRRMTAPAIVLIVLTSAALAVTTSGAHETHAAGAHHGALVATHGHASPESALTARQAAFHDAMRKLWEDHITWTRLAIVSFAVGLPDLQATEARLLANQVDIGNAIKPYYGRAAGNRLAMLIHLGWGRAAPVPSGHHRPGEKPQRLETSESSPKVPGAPNAMSVSGASTGIACSCWGMTSAASPTWLLR